MNAGQWWKGLKRAAAGFVLLVGVVVVGMGIYTLYLAHEIASAEKRVVVPLPTESPENTPTVGPTPTPLTPYTPTPSHAPATTLAAAVTPPPAPPPPMTMPPPATPRPPTATAVPTSAPPQLAPLTHVPTAPAPPAATPPPAPRPSPPPFATNTPAPEPPTKLPAPTLTSPPPPAPTATHAANVTVVPLATLPPGNATTATPVIIVLVTVTPTAQPAATHTLSPLAEVPHVPLQTIPAAPAATPTAPASPSPSPTPLPPKPTAPPMPTPPMPPFAPSTTGVLRGGVGAATGESDGHEAVWGGKQYVHILLMGLDRRDNEPARSDTMILATVNLWDGAVSLLSIPRDLLVPIPGHGEDRINAAFAYGQAAHPHDPAAGPALAVKTVSMQFNVPIEQYLFVDFKGYKEIVDALGGIDITVPQAIDDPQYPTDDYGVMHLHFDAGKQHMNGDRALAYARTRHTGDDDARRERQMQVMQTVLLRALQIDSVRTLPDLVKRLGNNMQTSLPYEAQLSLVKMGRKIQANGVKPYSIRPPLVRPYVTAAGADVYLGDWASIRPLVAEATAPKRKAKP